mmetsp:Transcript_18596/g.30357  ORF Transcript_18596/g.30357 Transcript_18596/m.30357 type:complete len:387 (+) Transcript_18596:296-1456(+)
MAMTIVHGRIFGTATIRMGGDPTTNIGLVRIVRHPHQKRSTNLNEVLTASDLQRRVAVGIDEINKVFNNSRLSNAFEFLCGIAADILHAIIRNLERRGKVGGHDIRSLWHIHLCIHRRAIISILRLRRTDFERASLLVVGKILVQIFVQIQAAVRAFERLRLAMAVNILPRTGRHVERTLRRTVKVDQTRRPRVGTPNALVDLIVNLVRLRIPMLSARNIPARHEEGTGFPESAVGLFVNVDGGNVGIGLEVVDEELALAVDALVGAGVEDGGGHADLDGHDSVGGEGGDEGVDHVGIGVLFVFFGILRIDDENVEFTLNLLVQKVLERIGNDQIGTAVIKAARGTADNIGTIVQRGHVLSGNFHDLPIEFDHGGFFDGLVFEDLA